MNGSGPWGRIVSTLDYELSVPYGDDSIIVPPKGKTLPLEKNKLHFPLKKGLYYVEL